MLLKIDNLKVSINEKEILRNYKLKINTGEIHAIMGPNGCGKSTLAKTIMGDTNYQITAGSIFFKNQDITNLKTDERAKLGIFLAMQSPIEIEGVSNADLLRSIASSKEKANVDFLKLMNKVNDAITDLKMDPNIINRFVNAGFSGGERKKNEILQMKILKPKLVILDEIDSGLDIDSLKIVASNINQYKKDYPKSSLLIITHYPRVLEFIKPDYVHIMTCGKIVKSGDYNLALAIEKQGYKKIETKKDGFLKSNVVGENKTDE